MNSPASLDREASVDGRWVRFRKESFRWFVLVDGSSCVLGIVGSLGVYGVLQEYLMTSSAIDPAVQRPSCLVAVNRLLACLVVTLVWWWRGAQRTPIVPIRYGPVSVCNVMSTVCQYAALFYVEFPVLAMVKAGRMVVTMAVSAWWTRRLPRPIDAVTAGAATAATVAFVASYEEGHASGDTSLAALGLLLAFSVFDAHTSVIQKALYNARPQPPSTLQMMVWVNGFSLLLVGGASVMELPTFLIALFGDGRALAATLGLAVTSVLGQVAILHTISEWGPVVFAGISVVRTLGSIVVSCLLYDHALSRWEQALVVLVFAVLALRVVLKARQGDTPAEAKASEEEVSLMAIEVKESSSNGGDQVQSETDLTTVAGPRVDGLAVRCVG